jgi:DNA-binding transcriptional MerR regulator
VPIDEVARRFGLRASALRYYEERGLLTPASRRGGRRWYGRAELRRLAIITFWRQSGRLSLDEIAAVLAGPAQGRHWKDIVHERIEALDTQIDQMASARGHLEHMLTCPREHSPDGCPYFEEAISQPRQTPARQTPARKHPARRREAG